MYPIFRFMVEMRRARKLPPLAIGETHATGVTCLPWDIDYQFEMNNGRILTLFDIGRVVMLDRLGFVEQLGKLKLYGTIAGSTVRYRRRVTLFQKLELRSRIIGLDKRFFYIEQSFWRKSDGECSAHAVLRVAITSGKGIMPTAEVIEMLEMEYEATPLPDWIVAWDASEQQRPWPPERG